MTLPFAQNLIAFVALYVAMQMLHVAHESPKNVLVTENYSRNDWERSFGFYEGLTEIGFIIGLAAGMVMFAFISKFLSFIHVLFLSLQRLKRCCIRAGGATYC